MVAERRSKTTDIVEQTTKGIRLVPAPAAKNSCKDRSGDGHLCGSVFTETVTKKGKKVDVCYPAGHILPKKRKQKTTAQKGQGKVGQS